MDRWLRHVVSIAPDYYAVFDDVATDGALRGPNLAALRRLVGAVSTPVVASGGISTLDDVRAVAALGVIGLGFWFLALKVDPASAPAILSAIHDATGVWVTHAPTNAMRLVELLAADAYPAPVLASNC